MVVKKHHKSLISDFQALTRKYFICRCKPLWKDLIVSNFGLADGIHRSLADIGQSNNLTRERVRQIRSLVLRDLKKLMNGETIDRLHEYCEAPKDVSVYKGFEEHLRGRHLLTLAQVEKGLPGDCEKDTQHYKNWLDFLMMAWGYDAAEVEGPIYYRDYYYAWLSNMIKKFRRFLKNQPCYVSGPFIEGSLGIDTDDLEFFFEYVKDVEEKDIKGVRHYRVPTRSLDFSDTVIHRILHDRGSPMHISDLRAEMDKAGWNGSMYPLGALLLKSKNLRAIGRSGMWVLKDWGMDTSNIWEVLERVLRKAGKPLSAEEISWKAGIFREIDKSTVQSIMCTYGKIFAHYADGKYGLKEWKSLTKLESFKRSPYKRCRPLKKDLALEEALTILKRNKGSMPLKDLRAKMRKSGGYANPLIFSVLSREDLFEKTPIVGRRGRACIIALKQSAV